MTSRIAIIPMLLNIVLRLRSWIVRCRGSWAVCRNVSTPETSARLGAVLWSAAVLFAVLRECGLSRKDRNGNH